MELATFLADIAILGWLVVTWFYEGHHRRCEVAVTCPHCGQDSSAACLSDRRHQREHERE